jgi:hypothetical protein
MSRFRDKLLKEMNVYFLISISFIHFSIEFTNLSNALHRNSLFNNVKKVNSLVKRISIDYEDFTSNSDRIVIIPKILPFWPFVKIIRPIIKRPALRVIITHLISQFISFKQSIVNALLTKFQLPFSK